MLLDEHLEFTKTLRKGEATAEQVREQFEKIMSCKELILAELGQKTKNDLYQLLGYRMNEKKASLVDRCWHDILGDYIAPRGAQGNGVMYNPFGGETLEDAYRKAVQKVTDEHIAEYAEKIQARSEEFVQAITNPETISQYERFIYYRGAEALSDGQLAHYDKLVARRELEQENRDRELAAQVSRVDNLDGVELTVEKSLHDKKQIDIWIVRLSERVDRNTYKELLGKAKRLGGYWSRFSQGFIFKEEEPAKRFAGLKEEGTTVIDRWQELEAERQERVKERFLLMAQRRDEAAEDSLNRDRKTNTRRRIRMALSVTEDAYEGKRLAEILEAIARAIDEGRLEFLSRIRFASQVMELERTDRPQGHRSLRQALPV
jgi:hypothetical protein